jgi:hypothetical protein
MYVQPAYAKRHDRCLDQQANPRAFIDLDQDGGGAEAR